jgi:hypothetical protein
MMKGEGRAPPPVLLFDVVLVIMIMVAARGHHMEVELRWRDYG